ncbi:hypothetical protein N2152v2_010487 [Parachlorella kessleri]
MADLRTGEILQIRQDVVRLWQQGLALPGATPAYLHAQAQALQNSLPVPQLPDVPIKYNIDVMVLMATLAQKKKEKQQEALVAVVGLTEASPDGRLQVAAAGMVPMLVKLLREGANGLKSGALSALANLCKEPAPAASVLAAGAVPLLVQYAQGGPMANMGTQEHLKAADKVLELADLASSVANVNPGAQKLKKELQAEALRRLQALATKVPESRPALVAAGATDALAALLKSSKPDVQAQAALLVVKVAPSSPRPQIANIIPAMVDLLDDSDINVQAAQAVALLWQECPEHHSALVDAGALCRLADQMDKDRPLAVQCAGAKALASIYTKDPVVARANIKASVAIYALLGALKSSDGELQRYAARAVANLSGWAADLRHDIVDTGTISPFVELLRSVDGEAQDAARRVLQNLPCDAEHTLKLIHERKQIVLENKLTELASDSGRHEDCRAEAQHCTDHAMMLTITALQIVKAAEEAGTFSVVPAAAPVAAVVPAAAPVAAVVPAAAPVAAVVPAAAPVAAVVPAAAPVAAVVPAAAPVAAVVPAAAPVAAVVPAVAPVAAVVPAAAPVAAVVPAAAPVAAVVPAAAPVAAVVPAAAPVAAVVPAAAPVAAVVPAAAPVAAVVPAAAPVAAVVPAAAPVAAVVPAAAPVAAVVPAAAPVAAVVPAAAPVAAVVPAAAPVAAVVPAAAPVAAVVPAAAPVAAVVPAAAPVAAVVPAAAPVAAVVPAAAPVAAVGKPV